MRLKKIVLAVAVTMSAAGCGSGSSSPPTAPPPTPTTTTVPGPVPAPAPSTSTPPPAPAPAPVANGSISVQGTQFLRDGVIWSPHGLNVVAFVAAPATRSGLFGTAYNNFNAAELAAMKAWGADTLRFQASQPALDPDDEFYDSNYLPLLAAGVKAARAIGLNVIVCMDDEAGSGETSPTALPNAGTGRAWGQLVPALIGDNGIMFELMNEPQPAASPSEWQEWAAAMNSIVTIIRSAGASNVLIADGLGFAEQLNNAPVLNDNLHQVAYASHPYAHSSTDQTEAGWNEKFGEVSVTAVAPVIVTEWSLENTPTPPHQGFQYCDGKSANAALNLLNYLQSKNIGLLAFSYDLANQPNVPRDGRITVDDQGTPSSLVDTVACTGALYGPGKIVQSWYQTGTVPGSLE